METNNKALKIEQLEDRFETTVAALDGDRCSGNDTTVGTGGGGEGGGEEIIDPQ